MVPKIVKEIKVVLLFDPSTFRLFVKTPVLCTPQVTVPDRKNMNQRCNVCVTLVGSKLQFDLRVLTNQVLPG